MKRKVLRIGNASLAMSLPSDWVRLNSLQPGADLNVESAGSQLRVSALADTPEREITITLPKATEFAKRLIFSPYIQGYAVIRVRYEDPAVMPLIEDALTYLMGFEIVDQQPGRLTVRNVAEGLSEEFDPIFNRIVHLVRLIATNVQKSDASLFDETRSYLRMIDRLHIFCRRLLNTRVRLEPYQLTARYRTVCTLEEISDEYGHICDYAEHHAFPKGFGARVAITIQIHDDFAELSAKPTTERLARIKYACKEAQRRLGEKQDLLDVKLWEIVERYRTVTEEIIFPFREHAQQ